MAAAGVDDSAGMAEEDPEPGRLSLVAAAVEEDARDELTARAADADVGLESDEGGLEDNDAGAFRAPVEEVGTFRDIMTRLAM